MADETEDWTPDKEKEDDPAKLQKEAIKIQKEGLAFYKGVLEKEEKRRLAEAEANSYATATIGPAFPHKLKPKQITVQVRKIDNGFILARVNEVIHPSYGGTPEETYYPTILQLTKGLEEVVREAFVEIPAGT
jgi:hypothetical protein